DVAFTTRHGGRSATPFESLNLSYSSGDDAGVVRANRRRALAAVGGALESWTGARQVHGVAAVHAGIGERGAGWESPSDVIADADALWTAALCTRCEQSRFFSQRAGARGRQGVLARIAL